MRRKLRNKYFILRHGESTHQVEKPNIVYYWPEDKPPAPLTKKGKEQIKKRARSLKNKNIDLIFSSDAQRTKETANIVAQELGLRVYHDKRLRDINWGIYQGKSTQEAWEYYYHNMEEKFEKFPPQGESWGQLKERMIDFVQDIDKKYREKNILIVSHGDPLWLLDSWAKELDKKEMIKNRKSGCPIKIGDLKKLN
ncbi:hypothetical protein AMJ50_01130 [Parcubacteria bacterium DG_74_3]|nr:MAG: hypothetical protein AMJ50_01130 [Parcubacteria bacterium DG_74_3]